MNSIGKPKFERRDFLKMLSLGAATLAVPGCIRDANRINGGADRHPNVVFIMADDMGYGDVGCYNSESKIPTPNIDRLAKQGVLFTDAHSSSAVCTPTRYGVLTGRYCWRTWLKSGVVGGYTNPLIERDLINWVVYDHAIDNTKIKKLGLKLKWPDLKKGVMETMHWYRKRGIL